jgi:hypothetical protein
LLALLAITQVGCPWDNEEQQLVLEYSAIGSWIEINNRFTFPGPLDPPQDPAMRYYWTGILFQIGNFTDADYLFDEVVFSKNGTQVGSVLKWDDYPAEKAFWVNIVSKKFHANHLDPLPDPNKVLGLYPGPYPPPGPCSDATSVTPECLRTAMLHPNMERVIGLITYWQGPEGYELEAKQEDDEPEKKNRGNSYTFRLKDDFRVEIYEINPLVSPRTVAPVDTHNSDDIDLIKVKKREKPPENGDKQNPPWQPPPP